MAVNLTAVRKALVDKCRPLVANVYSFEPTEDSAPDYPAVWLRPPAIEKKAMAGDHWEFVFELVLAVSEGWDQAGQQEADRLVIGLWPLIEADDTLTATIDGSVIVTGSEPVRPTENVAYQGAVLTIEVAHTDA